jgi:hypothetical protein
MSLSRIDDKKLKSLHLVFLIQPGEWRNLPHERRSSNTSELQQDVLFSNKVGE